MELNSEGIGAKSAVASHFIYEIRELRRPIGSRCIEFLIRPNFLTPNSRYLLLGRMKRIL
ncbi:hypothetical protein [Leptospira alexanderi]|uniref:hypothetical protein n=1 Tax=Leptospira alexanderi TaxID=100053 RepID=UPI0009DC117A